MRIVAGTARGRRIQTLEGREVRPTMDRVREAIFNSLHSHGLVEDRTFVDLFAGSGALGLEALSRGAASVLFVDRDRRSIQVVEQNLEAFGMSHRATVRCADAETVAAALDPVDVVLADPPYGWDGWSTLIASIRASAVVAESDRPVGLGDRWEVLKEKRYAGTVVRIARSVDSGRRAPEPGVVPPDRSGRRPFTDEEASHP